MRTLTKLFIAVLLSLTLFNCEQQGSSSPNSPIDPSANSNDWAVIVEDVNLDDLHAVDLSRIETLTINGLTYYRFSTELDKDIKAIYINNESYYYSLYFNSFFTNEEFTWLNLDDEYTVTQIDVKYAVVFSPFELTELYIEY